MLCCPLACIGACKAQGPNQMIVKLQNTRAFFKSQFSRGPEGPVLAGVGDPKIFLFWTELVMILAPAPLLRV